MSSQERNAIGRTSATFNVPNTVNEFYFWVSEDKTVQPYDFVTARYNDFSVIGVVNEISIYTDAQSHLSNRLGADAEGKVTISRLGTTVAKALVFYSFSSDSSGKNEEERMPVPSDAKVYMSTPEEMLMGLSLNEDIPLRIPAGVAVSSSGVMAPIPLDARYLLGPEAAHCNVSGISGLATKTSYMMFLLRSVNEVAPNKYINIIFNVKQADLMRIDEPADLSPEDIRLYEVMFGKVPSPFTKPTYLQPLGKNGVAQSYSNKVGTLFSFALADCFTDLDLLFGDVDDAWQTVESFSRAFQRDWDSQNKEWRMRYPDKNGKLQELRAGTWRELSAELERNGRLIAEAYGLQSSSVSRIRRHLARLTDTPLFESSRGKAMYIREAIRSAVPGNTLVVDIAKLRPTEQAFVVGEVFRELEDIILREQEGNLRRAVVVVDELNSLAPSSSDNPLKEQIVEVARKGRSAGFVIFGAEQFASQVEDQITGNSSLRVYGRTSSVEANTSAYRSLTQADHYTVMTLKKGEMLCSFPTFRSNIKLVFPRPPYATPE